MQKYYEINTQRLYRVMFWFYDIVKRKLHKYVLISYAFLKLYNFLTSKINSSQFDNLKKKSKFVGKAIQIMCFVKEMIYNFAL